jgi:hypothetical protein
MEEFREEISGETVMSKPRLQARLAALSFTEKIKILEKLRDREHAISASGLRALRGKVSAARAKPSDVNEK